MTASMPRARSPLAPPDRVQHVVVLLDMERQGPGRLAPHIVVLIDAVPQVEVPDVPDDRPAFHLHLHELPRVTLRLPWRAQMSATCFGFSTFGQTASSAGITSGLSGTAAIMRSDFNATGSVRSIIMLCPTMLLPLSLYASFSAAIFSSSV